MPDFLPGLEPTEPQRPTPQTAQEWFRKRFEVTQLFSPTEPVREADMFVGRTEHIRQVTQSILQAGQHIVVYGDPGVGKTSLVNVISNRIFGDIAELRFFKVRCLTGYDFVDIWGRALNSYKWEDGSDAVDDINSTLDANIILEIVSKFEIKLRPVFVFDEFDRIVDEPSRLKLAETIKLLSDEAPRVTIMVVGVAKTVRGLISDHESIKRAIRQVLMPRMTPEEIRDIVRIRLDRAGIGIDEEAMKSIVWLAHGMPSSAHLLGMNAALAAIDRRTIQITEEIVIDALQSCLDAVDETTREAYSKATQSTRPGNYLKEVLLACAMTATDEFGRFTAAAVRKPISLILGRPRDIPDFNRQLKQFCTKERGHVLGREGTARNFHYKFCDPLMQSYVMIKGIKDNMLPMPNGH